MGLVGWAGLVSPAQHAHTHARAHTHMHTHARTHAHTHPHTHTHTHTQALTNPPSLPQIRITPSISADNETSYEVSCERHILTTFLLPDLLLLSAFLYGLYIFRWAQTEQLSTLTEAVREGGREREGEGGEKREREGRRRGRESEREGERERGKGGILAHGHDVGM